MPIFMNLRTTSLNGLHDDRYWRELLKKHPDSLIAKAFVYPKRLTLDEMERVVKITGEAEICEKWMGNAFKYIQNNFNNMLLSEKVIDFILHIYSNGFVTKKTQHLHPFQYYTMIWYLRDKSLIAENGIKNNQKEWVMTEKGKKVAVLLKEIKEAMHEGQDIIA